MKKSDNRGSVLILVIVALALLTIFTGIIFTQINHQTKSNYNLSVDVHLSYAADSGIENTIAKVTEQIESKVNKYAESLDDKKDPNIYVEIPDENYMFDDGYGFVVKDIPKVPIEITKFYDKVLFVNDIVITISSKGIYKGDEHNVESQVVFKTKKSPNGKFETRYFVNTYKNI